MNTDDRNEIIRQLSHSIGSLTVALDAAIKGERSVIESEIKTSYFGLDQALYIARERPVNDASEYPLKSFVTPQDELPDGHDTVLGWLAKNNPDRLLSDYFCPMEDSKRDGFALKARANREKFEPPKVPACEALGLYGITEINAYPNDWLAERLSG